MPWFCDSVTTTVWPQEEAVSVDDAIEYIKASPTDRGLLSMYTVACRAELEKRLGRSIVAKTVEGIYSYPLPSISLVATMIDYDIHLVLTPVTKILQVQGLVNIGEWQNIPFHEESGDRVMLEDISSLYGDVEYHVKVNYACGPLMVDPADKLMVLQYIAHRYLYREDDNIPDTLKENILRTKDWRL